MFTITLYYVDCLFCLMFTFIMIFVAEGWVIVWCVATCLFCLNFQFVVAVCFGLIIA